MPSRGKKYGNASQVTTHVDSYANGGPVKSYGSPLHTENPPSLRKRPKVGDKDPNYKPRKPRKSSPAPAAAAKKGTVPYNHRDYRGTKGAIDDADPPSKKK